MLTRLVLVTVFTLSLTSIQALAATQYLTNNTPVYDPDPLDALGKAPGYVSTLTDANIRLFLHSICLDDGSGGLSEAVVDSMVTTARGHLEQLGVYLVVSGRDSVLNSSYYAAPDSLASDLFLVSSHTNAIDVYLGPAIGAARGRADGYSENVHDEVNPLFSQPTGICAFDYDLNGTIDFAYSNRYRAEENYHRLIENTGSSGDRFEEFILFGSSASRHQPARGLGATDWNLDGFTELLICNVLRANPADYAETAFFKLGGATANNWIGIRLSAMSETATAGELPCNSHGIGATVIVTAGTHVQAQVVDGGSGNASQRDLDLSFGLGAYSGDVDIEVIWPCGQTQYETLASGQYHTIILESPELVSGSVQAYTEWGLTWSHQNWVFKWKTTGPSDLSRDSIEFPAGVVDADGNPVDELYGSRLDVTYEQAKSPTGGYEHEMIWTNAPCSVRGQVNYEIHNRVADQDFFLSRWFSVFTCPVSP